MTSLPLMLYSLERLVTEVGPLPTLSALYEAALAHLFDVIQVPFDEAIEYEDGTEEAMIEQVKAVRREAIWDGGCNAAEEEEILTAQVREVEDDAKQSFLDFVEDSIFWDRE